MTILIIDGMNFLHRARAGFTLGSYPVCFNFFRNLRALVEKHSPTRVYLAMEGHPGHRHALLPEYKANRHLIGDPADPEVKKKQEELDSFFRQVHLITDLLQSFPVSVVRHPRYEADDVVYNLIKRSPTCTDWVVASNDSDFTQLLNEFNNVKVYNPMTKALVTAPDYCYVTWKALRGDPSDNIPGLPGVSDAMAEQLVRDADKLQILFDDQENKRLFARNYGLIKLREWSDKEAIEMTSSSPARNWDHVAAKFDEWAFKSLLKEPTWTKFRSTFDPLFG